MCEDARVLGSLRPRTALAALATLAAPVVATAASPQGARVATEFAFGDVFARDLATLGADVGLALGLEPGWDVLCDYGALTRRGTSYGLFGPTAQPVYLVVPEGSPAVGQGVEHRAFEVIERAPSGAPDWERASTSVHVTRALTANPAQHARAWSLGSLRAEAAVRRRAAPDFADCADCAVTPSRAWGPPSRHRRP